MNTSPKLLPILVVAVLGIASLTLLTSAWGDTSGAPVQAAWSGNFDAPAKRGDRLSDNASSWHGHHGWMAHAASQTTTPYRPDSLLVHDPLGR
jgi:hypothetical protein